MEVKERKHAERERERVAGVQVRETRMFYLYFNSYDGHKICIIPFN